MLRLDKQTAADWIDTYSAAFRAGDGAQTSAMLREMSLWSRQSLAAHLADYRDASEGLDVIIDGLRRLRVAVPASMIAARDACMLAAGMTVTEQPSLTRRARLIIIGGAAVAAAAYAYHRYRRAAKRADLEAVKSLLAGGDSAASLDATVTPQRRTPQSRPSAKERSKVMERNKKLQAQKRAAETARDAATADAARARADNDRLRAENARLASSASAGDERDAAESERLRAEVDRLSAEVARNADEERVRARRRASQQRADEEAIADLQRENDALLAAKAELERHSWDVAQIESERAEEVAKVIVRDMQIERLRADKASLVAERDSLRAERDALEEDAQLVPAPSAGDLAALTDDALAAFSAEAAALSHTLVREDARRAAVATTSTNECVVCHDGRSRSRSAAATSAPATPAREGSASVRSAARP